MPNEEIITSLRNAIEHGDSLQKAMQIMVNSGYDFQEVQEASGYVGEGAMLETRPQENEFITPGTEKKKDSFFSKINIFKKKKTPLSMQQTQEIQTDRQKFHATPKYILPAPSQKLPPQTNKIYQQPGFQQRQPLSKQLKKIQPPGKSYLKEIVLLTLLIILVGILITTIIFRDNILRFFSG